MVIAMERPKLTTHTIYKKPRMEFPAIVPGDTQVLKRDTARAGEKEGGDLQAYELRHRNNHGMHNSLLEGAVPPYQQQKQHWDHR